MTLRRVIISTLAILLAWASPLAAQTTAPGVRAFGPYPAPMMMAQVPAAPSDANPPNQAPPPPEDSKTPGPNGDTEPEKKDDKKDDKKDEDKPGPEDYFSVHGQATVVSQGHGLFHSPYQGQNSLLPSEPWRTTETSTLYLGYRLWDGGTLFFNPEIAGGTGLSGTLGVAGFPNGEATRVGAIQPTPYIARLYYSQVFGFGGGEEKIEDGPNSVKGKQDIDRITVSGGKFSAQDFFDNNSYSHDPRTQFMNWALMYNGAWDFPADTRGYTWGGVIDINHEDWAIRYGIFAEPFDANGPVLDPHFDHAHGQALEYERRFKFDNRPGKLRLMAYLNGARMVHYQEAIDTGNLDLVPTGQYSNKYGFCLNLEQQLSDDVDSFMRLGWNDGATQTWAFTEIDRTFAIGATTKGTRWCRPQDQVGSAVVINGISPPHRELLADGGYGFIIGDGQLNYGLEETWENYYRWEVRKNIYVTGDLQFVVNPAYNRDRGPVLVEAIRVHADF